MQRFFHNYKGIIIQNDDPEKMGRVKVFVPEISMTLFKNWNDTRDKDKKFTNLGDNLESSLTPEILDRLRKSLPWAIVKQPIFGMGTGMTYHADKNFSEPTNDTDNSVQHQAVNKLPGSSSPANNPSSSSKAIANYAASSPKADSPSAVNSYSNNTATSSTDYISNAQKQTVDSTEQKAIAASAKSDNISQIVISFIPNERNTGRNLARRFTTSATVTTSDFSITGNSSATTAGGTTEIFTNKTVNVGNSTVPAFSPPITYTPTALASPIVVANNNTALDSHINVTFIPNDRAGLGNNPNRRFTTSASIITLDGQTLTVNGSAQGLTTQKTFSVNVNDIQNMNIVYASDNSPVNLSSDRLGGLKPLLAQYQNGSSSAIPSSNSGIIAPPATIASGNTTPPYNKGGSGADLFSLVNTNLLPTANTVSNSIKGINPNNKSGLNYGKKVSDVNSSLDPNKTVGSNQQTPADALPAVRANSQGNKVKGAISIPAVGSHVSVYFDAGDPLYPIIDGVFYNQEDYKGVHDVAE